MRMMFQYWCLCLKKKRLTWKIRKLDWLTMQYQEKLSKVKEEVNRVIQNDGMV
ncbi:MULTISPECIES: hypothetical protein [unclassified Streptococcus]|uniref:hypothetical protein n=1 Tax=unclassified Streptococcus TaxID=2608887 RepID=UPI00211AA6DD|nr:MULTISPECIES: hypothetical protein [unclassified Streptococcus]MCQ9212384.1 hypothetical protein [Streptococcus sp. B01]MCQ9213723.1 hypothetical protein [Streptococcus sp. O1]MCQ9214515.1 hypothetical protein [Streptococcus sp. O1]